MKTFLKISFHITIITFLLFSMSSCLFMRAWFAPNSLIRDWNRAVEYRNTIDEINLSGEFQLNAKREFLLNGISPLVSFDGETLYYTDRVAPNYNVETSVFKYNIMDSNIKYQKQNFEISKSKGCNISIDYISKSEDTAIYSFFVREPGEKFGNNWYYFRLSTKSFNVWGKPQKIFDLHLSEEYGTFTFLYSCFSRCKRYFVYSASNFKGYGGTDIFVRINKNNTGFEYSKPINLGGTINTKGMEYGVYLAPDNRTLYFSSSGHPGYGKTDIFMAKRLDDSWKRWTKPVNLGPNVNTKDYEFDFIITPNKELGFVVSNPDIEGKSKIYLIRFGSKENDTD